MVWMRSMNLVSCEGGAWERARAIGCEGHADSGTLSKCAMSDDNAWVRKRRAGL